jgi:hypothetical protein
MKILTTYKTFKENLDITTTDRPDEKLAKENINDTLDDLKEYKEKKPKIDQLYNSTKNDLEIQQALDKLMPEETKNQFLVDYLRICRIQSEIEKANYEQSINQSKKPTLQGDELKEIDSKINDLKTILGQKETELRKLLSEHKKKMADIEKEIKKDTQQIQTKK